MNAAAETQYPALIAILRGLTESDACTVGRCLYEAGLRTVEVPLNSPEPLRTITTLRALLPDDCLVGAGTVLTAGQVRLCHDAGAQIIVSPNTDTGVITATLELGMQSLPGTATPSEAFAALAAGADAVKAFPAEMISPAVVKAWRAVLPPGTAILPVGGITPDNMAPYVHAGAAGFGLGSALYKPGDGATQTRAKAAAFRTAWARLAAK